MTDQAKTMATLIDEAASAEIPAALNTRDPYTAVHAILTKLCEEAARRAVHEACDLDTGDESDMRHVRKCVAAVMGEVER